MSRLLATILAPGRDGTLALAATGGEAAVSYRQLRDRVLARAAALAGENGGLAGAPVAFLMPPGPLYVELLLAVMAAGGTAMPLSPLHTAAELAQLIAGAQPVRVYCHHGLREHLAAVATAAPLELLTEAADSCDAVDAATTVPSLPARPAADEVDALMLFTSGTTGRPKGVVTSHGALAAATASLHQAWGWRPDDHLLHVLPLHHTHGVVVALLGALWAGASVSFAPFDPVQTWRDLARASVFMAVPTIYAKLVQAFSRADPETQRAFRRAATGLRLCTSGSAALPASLLEAFERASGHRLLERYGMTEIGMALSNPLRGERLAGTVGQELPGVQVDIVGEAGQPCDPDQPGELRVRSPQMFSRYHGDPAATAGAFDPQGRFRTGDTGVREQSGYVRLLGRTAVDVLKSGGYKLSALEIEEALRAHPAIAEVAVIGLPDPVWGDLVTACVVPCPGADVTLADMQAFCRDRLAAYKWPRALRLLDELPRNAMGKVQKGKLKDDCR